MPNLLTKPLNTREFTRRTLIIGLFVTSVIFGVYASASSQAGAITTKNQTSVTQYPDMDDNLKQVNSPQIDQTLENRQNQSLSDLRPNSGSAQATPEQQKEQTRKSSTVIKNSQKVAQDYWHDVAEPGKRLCTKSDRGNNVKIMYAKFKAKNSAAYTFHDGNSPKGRPDCTIWVNSIIRGTIPADFADVLCETIVHEYGHLYGYNHTHHPGYIMNPHATGDKLERCNHV